MCLIHSYLASYLLKWKIEQRDTQAARYVSRQTGSPRSALLWRNKLSQAQARFWWYQLQKQATGKWKKERKWERIPLLQLWEAAGPSSAGSRGRKGSAVGLLFELCPLWFQSVAIYIPAISVQAEAGCSRFHHCIHSGDTAPKESACCERGLLCYFFNRNSPFRLGQFWCRMRELKDKNKKMLPQFLHFFFY